jgi:Putative bacterial sensory transduction regulator
MQWWPRRESGMSLASTDVARPRTQRPSGEHVVRDRQNGSARRRTMRGTMGSVGGDEAPVVASADSPADGEIQGMGPADAVLPVTNARLRAALDRLDVRYLTDGEGSVLAMWERHAVMIALEGPEDEILMMRTRPHATVPRDWADRAYRVVNEWNHSRRFCKAYVGDPTDRGQLPIYAEVQVPLEAGVHEALLVELLDTGVSVSQGFVEWLHDEGCLL